MRLFYLLLQLAPERIGFLLRFAQLRALRRDPLASEANGLQIACNVYVDYFILVHLLSVVVGNPGGISIRLQNSRGVEFHFGLHIAAGSSRRINLPECVGLSAQPSSLGDEVAIIVIKVDELGFALVIYLAKCEFDQVALAEFAF